MLRIVLSLILLSLTYSSGFVKLTESSINNGTGTKWAVLVAGSSTWSNYRHQADVCHAYHILRSHGIEEDHIITFMYDDIAYHPENPFLGKIFNDYRHIDYYEGVQIDYREENVSVSNFIRALLGCPKLKEEGFKVLESGPDDDVFIYFTDHGAYRLIAFPEETMTASQLNRTITTMHQKKKFKNLLFYLEACESGSMFEDILSNHINVFATTAANGEESSYASFCEDPYVPACLADEYSHNWMQDTETHDAHQTTLQQQFRRIRNMTKNSHVQEFGDMHLKSLPIGEFQGDESENETTNSQEPLENEHLMESRYLQIQMLRKQLEKNQNSENGRLIQRHLDRALQLNKMAIETFEDIDQIVRQRSPSLTIQNIHDWLFCYESAQKKYMDTCFKIQKVPAVAEILPNLAQLCKDGYDYHTIEAAIIKTCE